MNWRQKIWTRSDIVLAMASALPHLIFLLLLPCFAVAQTNGNVSVGASLTATDEASPWLSPSGDFAFGFHQLDNMDLFLLSIWYAKIPDRTIVWYAGGYKPVPRGSKVELTADRGLVLNDPQGEEIWTSDISVGAVAYGFMNDTGNFVLENRNSDKLWESFNNPTDTMLPTQVMGRGGVLSSRLSLTNFSQGRFQLRLLTDGNLVLNTMNLPTKTTYDAYYRSNTDDSNSSNSGYQVVFNESGYMYILRANNERVALTQGQVVPSTDFYHRATLNFDGVFTQYYHPKTSTANDSWSMVWNAPDNICLAIPGVWGSGPCGYNSICRLQIDRRPICKCPPGYSLLDPNNEYGSCKPDFIQGCDEEGMSSAENLYDFEELTSTDFPSSDYEHFEPYNEEECKKSCLDDCLCAAAVFLVDSCWTKKLPLSNGREAASFSGKTLLKLRKANSIPRNPLSPILETKKNQDTLVIVISVLLGSSVFVIFILTGVICVGFFFIYRNKFTRICRAESVVETNLQYFTYKELEEATNKFKEELGRGSFGVVYKGVIETGSRNFVAVKKLDRVVADGEKEFKTEVNVIGQTHHKNLVRLLGFCNEGQHRLLVYELLSNGTLASFLFGDLKPSWHQRTQIAFGIARGLLYLHEECSAQIIHCDIKPQNILLDDYYNARISDFGLAKLLMMNQSQTNTAIRGTKGYVAPEWFRNMPITVKVDVYSFGVLLLEIICCRRSVDMEIGREERAILTDWAYDCYKEGTFAALVENDAEAISDDRKLERFVMVAIWCIQEDPSLRPTMKKVMLMLEGIVQVTVPPCPSPFSTISLEQVSLSLVQHK